MVDQATLLHIGFSTPSEEGGYIQRQEALQFQISWPNLLPKCTDVPHLRIGNAANARPNLLLDLADPIFHLQIELDGEHFLTTKRGEAGLICYRRRTPFS